MRSSDVDHAIRVLLCGMRPLEPDCRAAVAAAAAATAAACNDGDDDDRRGGGLRLRLSECRGINKLSHLRVKQSAKTYKQSKPFLSSHQRQPEPGKTERCYGVSSDLSVSRMT